MGRKSPPTQTQPAECEVNRTHHHLVRLSWARLLKRVLELDLEHCPSCGGKLKIVTAILEQPVIEKMFTHAGLQAHASDCFEATNSGQSMSLMGRNSPLIVRYRGRTARVEIQDERR